MKKLTATYCPCGRVSLIQGAPGFFCGTRGAWGKPTTTLAALLKYLTNRGITEIVFIKMTCPDCFEVNKMGAYALKEQA